MKTSDEHDWEDSAAADRQWFREIAPVLFLVDVGLMFSAMVFRNAESYWVFVLFQLVAACYAAFVLFLAFRATRVVPASIPFQRPVGVVLYIAAHLIQFVFPGQLPIGLAGFVLLAIPISIMFLFAE